MLRYIYLLAIFFLFGSASSFSQVYQAIEWYDVDSLESVLQDQEGKERANTLYRLTASLCFEDFNKTTQYANDALILSENLKYKEGVAAATRYLGHAYYYNREFPKALVLIWKSINIYKELEDDYMATRLLLDLAAIHTAAKNFKKGLEFCHRAIDGFRKNKDDGTQLGSVTDTLFAYSIMGRNFRSIGRSDSALSIYLTYVDVGKNNNFETTNLLVHTGLVALCYTETGKYDSAIYYYQLALDFPEQNQSIKTLKHEFKRRLALIYLGMGRTDSAIYYLTDTYEWLSKAGFLMQSQLAALQLGETYLRMKEISKADFYFKHSEELLDEQLMKKSFFRYDSLKYTVSYGWEIWGPIPKKFMKEFIYNSAAGFYNKMYRYSKERGLTEPYLRYIEAYTLARDTLVKIEKEKEN